MADIHRMQYIAEETREKWINKETFLHLVDCMLPIVDFIEWNRLLVIPSSSLSSPFYFLNFLIGTFRLSPNGEQSACGAYCESPSCLTCWLSWSVLMNFICSRWEWNWSTTERGTLSRCSAMRTDRVSQILAGLFRLPCSVGMWLAD